MRRSWLLLLVLGCIAAWRASTEEPGPSPAPPATAPAAPTQGLPTLVVIPVEAAPEIDGDGSDAPWAQAPALVVTAAPDMCWSSKDQEFPVELRACATKDVTCLRVSWHVVDAVGDLNKDPKSELYIADSVYVSWRSGDERPGGYPTHEERAWSAAEEGVPGPSMARGICRDGRWTVEVRQPIARGAAGHLVVDVHGAHGASMAVTRVRWGSALRVVDFEADAVGQVPKGFHEGLTGEELPPFWRVRAAVAGASGNVLVHEDGTSRGSHYRMAVLDGLNAKDVDVSVRFQARDGSRDRAAGLVWRGREDHSFYLRRTDARKQSVVRFVGKDSLGVALTPLGQEAPQGTTPAFDPVAWHTLRATVVGDRIQAYLDGRHLFDVLDTTFPGSGEVGLWTEAGSTLAFDDLVVISLDPPRAPGR